LIPAPGIPLRRLIKSSLFQTFQHAVVRFLSAELRGKPFGAKEREQSATMARSPSASWFLLSSA
jgi:hypothetical protein